MAEQAYAYVTLIPVAKGFQSAVAKEMQGVGGVGDKAGKDAGGNFKGGFGGALKGIGGLIAGGLAAAGIGSFVKQSISQASDLSESLNALQVTYSDLGAGAIKELEGLGVGAANAYGLSQTAFNGFAVQFSSFATSIAGPGGDVVGTLESITGRAADFASVMNLEVADAAAIFQSGLAGETEPLKKFGIDLSAAAVTAYAAANGIGEVGKQLTEQEKVQARYGSLMEQTAKTQGDFANTSDGLANAQRILKANFENIQATVGGPLLGAFANLTTSLLPVVEQMGPVLTGVMEDLAPAIEGIARQIPYLLESFIPLIPVIGELAGVFIGLVAEGLSYFGDLVVMIMPLISELVPLVLDLAENAFPALFGIIEVLLMVLGPIIQTVLPVFAELLLALAPIITEVVDALFPLILALLPLLMDLLKFLLPILEVAAKIFGEMLVFAIGLFVSAVSNVSSVLDIFKGFFEDTFGGLGEFFYGIIDAWIGGFESFVNGVIRGVNFIIGALNGIQVDAPDWVTALTGFTSFGFNISRIPEISLPRVAFAEGGFVNGPTNALIGEAGPEVVMPLDRFEKVMGIGQNSQRPVNYYAAPNKSFDAEQELLLAMRRVKVMA